MTGTSVKQCVGSAGIHVEGEDLRVTSPSLSRIRPAEGFIGILRTCRSFP